MASSTETPAAPAPVAQTPAPVAPEFDSSEYERELDAEAQAAQEKTKLAEAAPAIVAALEPEAPTAPVVHKHSRRLTREALDWGFSQHQIDNTPSDELDGMVYEAQRQYRIAQEKQSAAIQHRAGQAPAPKAEDDEPEVDLGIDLKGWDADTVKVLKKIAAVPLKKVQELEAKLAEAEKRDHDRETRSVQQRLNSKLREYKGVFSDDAVGKAKQNALYGYLHGLGRQDATTLEDDIEDGIKLLGFSLPSSPSKPASPPPAEQLSLIHI